MYKAPGHDEVKHIMTEEIESYKCKHSDYQWTAWASTYDVDNDGNDYELLSNHM